MLGSARVAPRRDRECTWLRRLPHVCAQSLQAECGVRGQLVLLAVATRSDDFAAVASRRVSLSRAVGCSVRQVARGSPSQRAERESLLSAVQEVGQCRPCADFARGAPSNEVEWVPWGASVSGVNCRLYLNVLTVTHFRFRSHYRTGNQCCTHSIVIPFSLFCGLRTCSGTCVSRLQRESVALTTRARLRAHGYTSQKIPTVTSPKQRATAIKK